MLKVIEAEELESLVGAGDALFREMQHHGLSAHDEKLCVAGAAMDWWRRAKVALESSMDKEPGWRTKQDLASGILPSPPPMIHEEEG